MDGQGVHDTCLNLKIFHKKAHVQKYPLVEKVSEKLAATKEKLTTTRQQVSN